MRPILILITLLAIASCKGDKPADKPDDPKPAAAKPVAVPALPPGPVIPVEIPNLKMSIDMPEGAVASTSAPERDAHLEVGALMVNVSAVDEYSTPTLEKARTPAGKDRLIRDLKVEATADGWVVMQEVYVEFRKQNRFEVNVRRTVAGQGWDCNASMETEELAKAVLAACQTLR